MKLTKPQQKAIATVLVAEMKGYWIGLGRKHDYNDTRVFSLTLKKDWDSKKIYRSTDSELGKGSFRNTLIRTKVLRHVEHPTTKWDEYFDFTRINYPKLLEYENGREVIDLALTKLSQEENNVN